MKDTINDYEKMEELYELYEQKIYYVAYSVLHNIQQAEDTARITLPSFHNHCLYPSCHSPPSHSK